MLYDKCNVDRELKKRQQQIVRFIWQRDKAVEFLNRLCECPLAALGKEFYEVNTDFCSDREVNTADGTAYTCDGYNHCWMKYLKALATKNRVVRHSGD